MGTSLKSRKKEKNSKMVEVETPNKVAVQVFLDQVKEIQSIPIKGYVCPF